LRQNRDAIDEASLA
jgi:hypothetical protein